MLKTVCCKDPTVFLMLKALAQQKCGVLKLSRTALQQGVAKVLQEGCQIANGSFLGLIHYTNHSLLETGILT